MQFADLAAAQSLGTNQGHRAEPEFCVTLSALNVDVRGFRAFPAEKKKRYAPIRKTVGMGPSYQNPPDASFRRACNSMPYGSTARGLAKIVIGPRFSARTLALSFSLLDERGKSSDATAWACPSAKTVLATPGPPVPGWR